MTTILVTGTGAIIGYGILRALRDVPGIRTVAADIFTHAAGQHFADAFVQAPLTSDSAYHDWLENTIRQENIDLIVPGIEQDVFWLAQAVSAGTGISAKLCLNDPAAIRLCSDKADFDRFLVQHDEPSRILSCSSGGFDEIAGLLGLPFLLKPRRGYAGKGIVTISNAAEFARYEDDLGRIYLAQQIVGSDEAEYTVSAFCDAGAVRAIIALRRHLAPEGSTVRAETVDAAPFVPAIERLSTLLNAEGPTNFQFRMQNGDPKLLEINPRISSATSLRAAFGYNEATMCLAHFLHGTPVGQPEIRQGRAVRYIEDLVTYDTCSDL